MADYACLWDDDCVDNPLRVSRAFERCQSYGLTEKCQIINVKPVI